jgi:hypothetical protein
MSLIGPTGRCRRTRGQSPRVLMVGAAESAPYYGCELQQTLQYWPTEPWLVTCHR